MEDGHIGRLQLKRAVLYDRYIMKKVLFLVFLVAAIGSFVFIFISTIRHGPTSDIAPHDKVSTDFNTVTPSRPAGTFASKTGTYLSAQPFVQSAHTTQVTPDYYTATNNNSLFEWSYFEGNGHLEVMLFGEDTNAARIAAEKYIRSVLPYSKEQLCTLDARVITNEYENPQWAQYENLGLSFCPNAIQL